jgi:hypothetical protein
MRRLDDRHDLAATDRALRYLSERLRTRGITRPFIQPIEAVRQRAHAAHDTWLTANIARVAAAAEIEYCDDIVDAHVLQLAEEIQGFLGCTREDERFQALFPVAPAIAMANLAGDEQMAFVDALIARLKAHADLSRAFSDHLKIISADQHALEAALERRMELHTEEASARTNRSMALESARRMYNITHARLQLAICDDSDLLDSFFLPTD